MSDTKVEAPAPVPIAETKITEHDSAVNEEPVAKTAVDTPAEPVTTEKTPADAEAAPATQEAAKPKEVEEVKQEEAPAAQETDEQTKSAEVEAEEEEEVEPVTSGFLAQRGPRPLRLWQKRYFAFREEAYPLADLHLVYKKNTNRGLQLIRAAERSASGKAPETSKQVNDVFNNIASATVSGKGLLFYYKNDNDKTPLGIINLRNLAEGSPAAEKNIRAHAFSLKTETRDYYLAAASDKELKAWIKGVEQEIAKLAEQADPSEAEEFKSTLEQLTQGKAFAKAPVSAPAAEEAKDDAEAGAAPKTTAVSDNEVFSGSEPEPEAPAETKDVAETTPSASKRKSYFAAFDSFFKGLKNEPVPAKAEDKGKTPAEEPAADAPKDAAPAEAAPEAATAKVDDAAEAKEATEKSAEEESKPEASTPAGPSATENAKQKAKDIGAFISTKIFPKRTPEESGNKEAQASEADAPAKKDAESTPKEVEEAAAPAETTGDVATAPEAAKEEAEAAAEETTPARATSPIQRTLTKLLRPLHLNKGQEAAAEKPAEDKEEADKPKEVAAEDKPAEAETAVEGETATAEARETTEVAAEEEKKVNRPTSFLRRLGTTLSRSGRPSTAAEPTEASKEEAAEAPKEETEAAAKEEAQPEATKADEETPADDASETPEVQSLKSGFLQKQSQFVKGYDRRFVTLTDSGKLMYGKSEKELKSHKSVNVTKTTQVVKIDDGKRPFTFDIITPSRTVRFVADSVEERTSWVDALAAYQETLPDPEPEAKGDDKAAGDKEAAAEEAAATTEEAPKLPEPIKAEDLTPEQPEVEAQPAKADAAPAAEEAAAPKEEPAAPQAEEGKAKKEEAAPAKE